MNPPIFVIIINLAFNLSFDFQKKTLHAIVTQTFKCNKKSDPNNELLKKQVSLNAVSFHNLTVEGDLEYFYDGKSIEITWNSPFAYGETRNVTFVYDVIDPLTGLFFNCSDEGYERPTYCITDHETERARFWVPCIDFPANRTTLDFTFNAPVSYTALANGELVDETVVGDQKITKYSLKTPCPSYLICIAVGDFICVNDKDVNGMPIKYFSSSDMEKKDVEIHLF